MKALKTNSTDWERFHNCFARIDIYGNLCKLLRFIYTAESVTELINSNYDLSSLEFSVNRNEIIELIEMEDKLKRFSANINFEIIEKIDTPFYNQMKGLTKIVYGLNPESVDKDIEKSYCENIEGLIKSMEIDPMLRSSYLDKLEALNEDKPSERLDNILDKNLWTWRDELDFRDMKEIDRILYNSSSEMAEIYYEMAPRLAINNLVAGKDNSQYESELSEIVFDIELDRNNREGKYDTFFHEMGHMLDNSIVEVINGQEVYLPSDQYMSVTESKYSERFYDNLIKDVENYIENYNMIKGTNYTDKEIENQICNELSKDGNGKFSDIFGAVTKDKYTGKLGHDYEYWDYGFFSGKPSKGQLNKEAFAHFTEATITGNNKELENLEMYFPNSYRVYRDMTREMRFNLECIKEK